MIKDKRRSQAAIRNLLDLISENRSMQSVFTTEGTPGLTPSYSGNNNTNIQARDLVDPDCSSSSGSGESMNYYDVVGCNRHNAVLEDRIHLPPIEDPKFPKLPSPHQTIPVLPPIRPTGPDPMTKSLNNLNGEFNIHLKWAEHETDFVNIYGFQESAAPGLSPQTGCL